MMLETDNRYWSEREIILRIKKYENMQNNNIKETKEYKERKELQNEGILTGKFTPEDFIANNIVSLKYYLRQIESIIQLLEENISNINKK